MIVGSQKPIKEIKEIVEPYNRVLILGCGTCVKTSFAGGEHEVAVLASALRLAFRKDGKEIQVLEQTVERQCEDEFIKEAITKTKQADVILSLACGAGVQMVASRFPRIPVLPGVNTSFIGILEKQGLFLERCAGCGDCMLANFGSICPVARCSKKLLNGPCGGSRNGKCEVSSDLDCAWQLIFDRAKTFGQLDKLTKYNPPKDWRPSLAGGPRKLLREDQII